MANTSRDNPISKRDLYYYRRRYQNRLFSRLTSFFAQEAERTGITKADLAEILDRDPAQITRWLSHPSNLTCETISDLLFGLGAEPEPPDIVRFGERRENYVHPLIARVDADQRQRESGRFVLSSASGGYHIKIQTDAATKASKKIHSLVVAG